MGKYWSEAVKKLKPYVAGEQPKEQLIKLNTNENAYPPSPKVRAAIQRELARLRLYPSPDAGGLRQAVADMYGLLPQNVFCANGSDEALALAFYSFFDPGTPVKTMDVTYSFYPVWAQRYGITLDTVPLREDFTVDVEGMCGGAGVVLANPNAPTGIALDPAEIERIVRSTKGVVIVDEAYVAFGARSVMELVPRYDNLVVARTFSKSHSLAGLRVGYIAAHEDLVRALEAAKDSFNSYTVDALAQAGAVAALADVEHTQSATLMIMAERERTASALIDMGLTVLPSSANFLFVRCADAAGVFARLREKGILVRHFPGGRTQDFLRVTIGTASQMDAFVTTMGELV